MDVYTGEEEEGDEGEIQEDEEDEKRRRKKKQKKTGRNRPATAGNFWRESRKTMF